MRAKSVRTDSLDCDARRIIGDMPANCDVGMPLAMEELRVIDSLERAGLIQWCELTKAWNLTRAGLRARNNLQRRAKCKRAKGSA